MAPLTIPDILRWDPDAIYDVFRIAKTREGAFAEFGTHLQRVQNTLADWGGDAGEAFHQSMSRHRQDIDQDGHESRRVATAVDRAEQDVECVRTRMMAALSFARENHLNVADDGTVTIQPGFEKNEAAKKALAFEQTGSGGPGYNLTIRGIMESANRVDDELAAAIRAAVGDEQLDESGRPIPGTRHGPQPTSSKLTPEQQEQVGQWSQATSEGDGGVGDCSRWAIVSALANEYGVREGPNGPEINLPPDVQDKLMGGIPLHFPPNKTEINRIASRQYNATAPSEGFQGGPTEMSNDLTGFGIPSTAHVSRDTDGLLQQMRADLQAGRSAIVNGAFPGSSGHFISITGIDSDGNFLVNDSNRPSGGGMNGNTLPHHATAAEVKAFLDARASYGAPGYSTVG
jgi:uncharacterized protein YukE